MPHMSRWNYLFAFNAETRGSQAYLRNAVNQVAAFHSLTFHIALWA